MKIGSLRAQIVSGAVLWSVGLFLAALLIAMTLEFRFRHIHMSLYGAAVSHAHVFWLVVLLFAAGGVVLVHRGLSPLERLRGRLNAVRSGDDARIAGSYPSEVQPLVQDLNALLEHQEETVRRATARAGDLAHGLKTPLALLTLDAERARAAGQVALAESLLEQIGRMRRQIEFHLAQARAAAAGATPGTACAVQEAVGGLVRALRRLYESRSLSLRVDVQPEHAVRVRCEDLEEMLGNLLDNACQWARSTVVLSASHVDQGSIVITVEDDGPGVPVEMRNIVLKRGMRADEATLGSGLGLAIVRDLAAIYGGSIALDEAPSGGLRAVLRLPAAQS